MKQYTIKGFADLLVSSTQYKGLITKEKRLLLLDRCNWFISDIVRQNILQDKPYENFVNISSQSLKRYLGNRNYKDIQSCLVGLGIVVANSKYSTKNFSKSFCLTKKAIELVVCETYIYSNKFKEKIKREMLISFDDINSSTVLKKILDNTVKLTVTEVALHYVSKILPDPKYRKIDNKLVDISEVNQFKMDRYSAYYNSFYALNEINDPKALFDSPVFYPPSIARSGRIYHTIASMPRYIRESTRVKPNELIWEVDMSSAQPSIIFLEWLNYVRINQLKGLEDEYNLCLRLVLEGGIYKYTQENSSYYKGLSYEKLKKNILSAMNAENKPTKPNKELRRLFPNVMRWVNNIKKEHGYKQMSHIGQSTEANIFVEVYKELPNEIFALLIHDCILVTEKDVVMVKEDLENRIRKLYSNVILPNHNLDKLFRPGLVSIDDDNLLINQFLESVKNDFEDGV